MAGTITVLDGIQFAKDTADATWTQDHATNEAVKTFTLHIPMSAKAARVIINGAYDPNGGRYHVRVKAMGITSITTPTKVAHATNQQVMEWTAITPPAVVDSGAYDCSAEWQTDLLVDVAQSSTTVNTTGLELIAQFRKEDSLDEWTDVPGGRINVMAYAAAAVTGDWNVAGNSATDTVLLIDNPATAALDNIGKFIFLEDVNTVAQCEIAFLVSQTGD